MAAGSSPELSVKQYTIPLEDVRAERRRGNARAGGTYLEPHHTHFLLVDDGSEGRYGTEIDFRARLEAELFSVNLELEASGMLMAHSFLSNHRNRALVENENEHQCLASNAFRPVIERERAVQTRARGRAART